MSQPDSARRPIRSFSIRGGRITPAQQRALDTLMPVYGLDLSDYGRRTVDFEEVFGRSGPVIVEIGFGNGDALLEMAQCHPQCDFIGVEVHRPGVGHLLLHLEQRGIANVRVFCADAIGVLETAIGDGTLDKVCLYFPDPWPKKKHHKRRILQPGFIEQTARKLKSGGIFHFATDWQDYAEEALCRLDHSPYFENLAGKGNFSVRPGDRPLTKFEQRGRKLNHGIWDLVMSRT
ncbi:MAG: tRNA (guanosine(46)-N7)-methyltransferase TrmB [Gammaproteobacteria bacterium]|nr:tRNA (guanosine(46)-N7)-methyltransferase TrmB [Gammaproteobacteria bacterium]